MIGGEEREKIRSLLKEAGAVAVGFSRAEPVEEHDREVFSRWLEDGKNAGMEYMHNHPVLRFNPCGLLDDAKTVISLAFTYRLEDKEKVPGISSYAHYRDYHKEIRRLLKPAIRNIRELWGGETRICVDSAPVRERYWGMKSGLGVMGMNGQLIVNGVGSYVFLAEIITDIGIMPDEPAEGTCLQCGRCVEACPGKALSGDGTLDAGRCLSYLTIEHKGELPGDASDLPIGKKGTIFGCDICQSVCPHNNIPLIPSPLHRHHAINPDTLERLATMTEEEFDDVFAGSSLKRGGLTNLRRNMGLDK